MEIVQYTASCEANFFSFCIIREFSHNLGRKVKFMRQPGLSLCRGTTAGAANVSPAIADN